MILNLITKCNKGNGISSVMASSPLTRLLLSKSNIILKKNKINTINVAKCRLSTLSKIKYNYSSSNNDKFNQYGRNTKKILFFGSIPLVSLACLATADDNGSFFSLIKPQVLHNDTLSTPAISNHSNNNEELLLTSEQRKRRVFYRQLCVGSILGLITGIIVGKLSGVIIWVFMSSCLFIQFLVSRGVLSRNTSLLSVSGLNTTDFTYNYCNTGTSTITSQLKTSLHKIFGYLMENPVFKASFILSFGLASVNI
ncbi:Fun14p SCDLUD_000504 [Saccharomycodes ludwigii]|uniref:Fun14p n=1 Tax=Saccharomycodes ludwigii TaxID=36035 RepID=UPI001E877607|nr:hypothetical protein SCDLUD_000504 [Saccharomycodes ludwigii]KAH3902909.1 hypothetical protein SCDLUD_000504 [Saccharomycodes ludwigii]